MSDPVKKWPGSIIDQTTLAMDIGKFLRTHRDGRRLLMKWLESVAPDRTETEYEQLLADAAGEREHAHAEALEKINTRRVAEGELPIAKLSDLDSPPLLAPGSQERQ